MDGAHEREVEVEIQGQDDGVVGANEAVDTRRAVHALRRRLVVVRKRGKRARAVAVAVATGRGTRRGRRTTGNADGVVALARAVSVVVGVVGPGRGTTLKRRRRAAGKARAVGRAVDRAAAAGAGRTG